MSACIYCKCENAHSLSHIIPESLGSNVTLKKGVCDECNVGINQEVEEPIIRSLVAIRSFFQLQGKRGKHPRLAIEVRYGTGRQSVMSCSASELLARAFVFKDFTDPNGLARKIAIVSFNREAIEEHRQRYGLRHADAPLRDIPSEDLTGLGFWVNFDFGIFADQRCLRMIGKIAFEWWCLERSPEFVSSGEYDDLRNYIRYGTEPAHAAVSILDNEVVDAYFSGIPFGGHLLYRHVAPQLSSLVMAVSPYSLVYYKVVLARGYRALAADSMLTCVNPQTGNAYSPKIMNPRGKVLRLTDRIAPDATDAGQVIQRISPRLLERLNRGMKDIIQQSANQAGGAAAD
jgi:hypothetical protein